MRGVAIVAAVAALMIGATGFGITLGHGLDGEHERITRQAMSTGGAPLLEPLTLTELAGREGSWGAVGAPDNPARGLASLDRNHCSGADWYDQKGYPQSKAAAQAKLEACRDYIFDRLNDAVRLAGDLAVKSPTGRWSPRADQMPTSAEGCAYKGQKGRAKCNVLESMGLALHAAQDFYSHSNWGDQADASHALGPENPPGLGNRGVAPWLDPNTPDLPFPEGLISGCYEGEPERKNCNYGIFKPRVKHDFLNKDSARKGRSKVNDNYSKAFHLAAQDTWRKWVWMETRIRAEYPVGQANAIICGLRKDSASSCP